MLSAPAAATGALTSPTPQCRWQGSQNQQWEACCWKVWVFVLWPGKLCIVNGTDGQAVNHGDLALSLRRPDPLTVLVLADSGVQTYFLIAVTYAIKWSTRGIIAAAQPLWPIPRATPQINT